MRADPVPLAATSALLLQRAARGPTTRDPRARLLLRQLAAAMPSEPPAALVSLAARALCKWC